MNLNKVLIVGNLTRDPEIKWLPSNVPVTNFSVATNRVWKDSKTGERQEQTEFHNITVYGKQAQTSADYLKKGQLAFVEGRLHTRSWEAEGIKQYRTEIIADRVQFGPKKLEGAVAASFQADETDDAAADSVDDTTTTETVSVLEQADDDVPF